MADATVVKVQVQNEIRRLTPEQQAQLDTFLDSLDANIEKGQEITVDITSPTRRNDPNGNGGNEAIKATIDDTRLHIRLIQYGFILPGCIGGAIGGNLIGEQIGACGGPGGLGLGQAIGRILGLVAGGCIGSALASLLLFIIDNAQEVEYQHLNEGPRLDSSKVIGQAVELIRRLTHSFQAHYLKPNLLLNDSTEMQLYRILCW